MKTLALAAAALLATSTFCFAQVPLTGGPNPKNPGMGETNAYIEERLVEIVNRWRVDKGLPAFKVDSRLTEIARQNVLRMLSQGWVDHKGYCVRQEEVLAVIPRLIRYGENYAFSFPKKENLAGEIVQAWLKEQRFEQNLLNDYQIIGVVSVCNTDGDHFVVMNLAKEKPIIMDGKQDPGSYEQPTEGTAPSTMQQPQQAESTEVEDIYGLSQN